MKTPIINDDTHHQHHCCICGRELSEDHCNNPWPLTRDDYGKDGHTFCCDGCNDVYVTRARMGDITLIALFRDMNRPR